MQTKRGRGRAGPCASLQRLAGGRLTVAAADQDLALLQAGAAAERQASALFAAIAGAARLPVRVQRDAADGSRAPPDDRRPAPRRRQAHRDHADGPLPGALPRRRRVAARAARRLRALARRLSPVAGLSGAGVHARQRHRHRRTTGAVALLGGVLATCLASWSRCWICAADARTDAVYSEDGRARQHARRAAPRNLRLRSGRVLLCWRRRCSCWRPRSRCSPASLLALATVLASRCCSAAVLHAAQALALEQRPPDDSSCALTSLRATTLRSLALAATGAVALFGSVALGGARDDLLRGIKATSHTLRRRSRRVGRQPSDDNQAVETLPAALPHASRAHSRVAGVTLPGRLPGLGARRVWIVARPLTPSARYLASQIVDGDAEHRGRTASAEVAGSPSPHRSPANTTSASAAP